MHVHLSFPLLNRMQRMHALRARSHACAPRVTVPDGNYVRFAAALKGPAQFYFFHLISFLAFPQGLAADKNARSHSRFLRATKGYPTNDLRRRNVRALIPPQEKKSGSFSGSYAFTHYPDFGWREAIDTKYLSFFCYKTIDLFLSLLIVKLEDSANRQ